METNDPNENFQNGVLELDLRSTPTLSSPIDPEFKKKYSRYNFERLIVRTKYLTKQYDSDFRLISVEPFFVDVSLYNPHKIFSVLENYRDGGIIVRVLDVKDIIENFYEITIEEYYFSLQMIKNIYKDA
ncbi:MAG: hypothetical protein KC548_04295, partial [Nanoarchaeota archaeon]|nr:hypothetical protein [Nanoarchaeota archaeon]